jgi:hypothetical protein
VIGGRMLRDRYRPHDVVRAQAHRNPRHDA